MLTFDPVKHEYRWHGIKVPHVTGIIAGLVNYSHIPPDVLERARQEGVAIHKMVQLHFESDLASVPDWMIGHRAALQRFVDETGFEVWAAEEWLFNPSLNYAGTPDLIGLLPKLRDVRGPACLDVKRSLFGGPAIGLQTAGYRRAWNEKNRKDRGLQIPDRNRFALQLRSDGTYRLERYEDYDDEIAFLACLQQYRWKRKHYPQEYANGSA